MSQPVTPWQGALLLAASTFTIMSGATIAPGLPGMQAHFVAHPDAALLTRLVLTMPGLFIVLCAFPAGALVDRAGRLPVLLGGCLLYGLAGGAGLLLDDIHALLASRALLGMAVAAVMTSVNTLIGDYFDPEGRARFLGLQASVIGFSGVFFLLAGGALADWSWRGPFAIYLSALLVLPLLLRHLYEPGQHQRESVHASHPSDTPWKMLAGLFAIAFAGMCTFYMVPTHLPFLMRELGHGSPLVVGISIATATLCSALVSLTYRRLHQRLHSYAIFALVFLLIGAGYLLVGHAQGQAQIMAAMLPVGMGMGLLMPNAATTLLANAPPHLRGRLVGLLTMAVFLGQFASPLVTSPLVEHRGLADTFTTVGLAMTLPMAVMLLWARAPARPAASA